MIPVLNTIEGKYDPNFPINVGRYLPHIALHLYKMFPDMKLDTNVVIYRYENTHIGMEFTSYSKASVISDNRYKFGIKETIMELQRCLRWHMG